MTRLGLSVLAGAVVVSLVLLWLLVPETPKTSRAIEAGKRQSPPSLAVVMAAGRMCRGNLSASGPDREGYFDVMRGPGGWYVVCGDGVKRRIPD